MSKFFTAAAGTLLVAGCAIPVGAPAPPPPTPSNATALGAKETRIFRLINAERQHQGLPALVYSARLDQMASIQAHNMALFQKMAHTLPDAKLPTLRDRARYVGYPLGRLSENAAAGYPNAETVVQGWMTSRGHRHNILDAAVGETGIGIARSTSGALYYCQVFGKQLTSF